MASTSMDDAMSHHHSHHHHMQSQPMAMTLVASLDTGPLLFEWWHPRTATQYCLSLVVIFAIAVTTEQLSAWMNGPLRCTASPAIGTADETPLCDGGDGKQPATAFRHQSTSSKIRVCAQHAAPIALNYALMLLVRLALESRVRMCFCLPSREYTLRRRCPSMSASLLLWYSALLWARCVQHPLTTARVRGCRHATDEPRPVISDQACIWMRAHQWRNLRVP